MWSLLRELAACAVGPRVLAIYRRTPAPGEPLSRPYPEGGVEGAAEKALALAALGRALALWLSPGAALWLAYGGEERARRVGLLVAYGMAALVALVAARGFSRLLNPAYRLFLADLRAANARQALAMASKEASKTSKPGEGFVYSYIADSYDCEQSSLPPSYVSKAAPCSLHVPSMLTPSGAMARVLGRPLIYPGSVGALGALLGPALAEGRAGLLVGRGGRRLRLRAPDGNCLDGAFVRGTGAQARTLVLVCEGNAGFYEMGAMAAPLQRGYSVLGWNTPGFAGSTGQPYPGQIQNAASTVMEFATEELGFELEDIIVYGWSIGGYPAAYLASRHPTLAGVILDATFDHVLPLALPRMPPALSSLVGATITQHFNLDVAGLAGRYSGPLSILRRSEDEIITTSEGDVATNRANHLALALLRARYPALFLPGVEEAVWAWLRRAVGEDERRLLAEEPQVVAGLARLAQMEGKEGEVKGAEGGEFSPEEAQRLLQHLAARLLQDVPGGHNSPLPASYVAPPWRLCHEPDFVTVDQ